MTSKTDLFLFKTVIAIHTSIVIMGFLGLFLIFYKPLQLFFIIFYITIVGLRQLFNSECPLTKTEDELRIKLKLGTSEEFFINRLLRKHTELIIPEKIIRAVLIIYFLISIFLLFKYF